MKKILFYVTITSLFSCNLDKWNLDDQSNELIPNYSLTLESLVCDDSFLTNIYPLDKNSFVTAVEEENNMIKVIKINQALQNGKWSLGIDVLWSSSGSELTGFVKIDEQYFISFISNGWPRVEKFDADFSVAGSYSAFESYIDTSYNDINSLSFTRMLPDTSNGIYLFGQLSSFSKKYSCVFKMDTELKPLYLKTYFENDTVKALLPLDSDKFVLLNQNGKEMSLILDNSDGKSYKKYDLSFNEVFSTVNLAQVNGKLYLTGNVASGTGKTMEITLDNRNAFISDVKNYIIKGINSFPSSRNTLLLSGVTQKEDIHYSFLTEYKDRNYLWCNEYQGFDFVRSLAIQEAPDVGLIYLFLVKKEDSHHLHIIRTDEEGATLDNPYDLNCLL